MLAVQNPRPVRRALSDVSLVHFAALIVGAFTVFMIVSTIKSLFTEVLGGDLVPLNYPVESTKLILFTLRELVFDGAFIGIFVLVYRYAVRARLYRAVAGVNSNAIDYLFFVLSVLLLLMLAFTNTGSVVRGDGSDNRIVDLAFALFQPFYLLIIYFYTREGESRRIHRFTFTFFFLACILSGFTGYLMYISPFLYSVLRRRTGRKGAVLLLAVGFVLLPTIRMLKFLYLYKFENLDVIFDNFGQSYLTFLEIVIDRFSYIPNVIFISDNSDTFHDMMHSGYLPFFQGYIGSLVHKVFAGAAVDNLNGAVNALITGFDDSNSTFPLISYFDVSPFLGAGVLAYGLVVNTVMTLLMAMVLKPQRLFFLGLVVSYTLLLGGWFWPYMNFVQAVLVYLAIQAFYKLLRYVAAGAAEPALTADER